MDGNEGSAGVRVASRAWLHLRNFLRLPCATSAVAAVESTSGAGESAGMVRHVGKACVERRSSCCSEEDGATVVPRVARFLSSVPEVQLLLGGKPSPMIQRRKTRIQLVMSVSRSAVLRVFWISASLLSVPRPLSLSQSLRCTVSGGDELRFFYRSGSPSAQRGAVLVSCAWGGGSGGSGSGPRDPLLQRRLRPCRW